MSNHLCKSKINCDDPNSPTSLFSSEDPDSEIIFSRFQMFQPPALGANWTSSQHTGLCQSTSQVLADECAMEDFMVQAAANNSAPPKCLLPVPPDVPCEDDSALFKNTPQTCIGTCPDGLPFSLTVPAGRFTAFSQAVADAMAHSEACNEIISNRVCIGTIPTTEGCVNNVFSDTVNCTANNGPLLFSIVSGSLPPGLSLASAGAFSFVIRGTPTTVGDFSFMVQALDPLGNFMQKRFTLSIVGLTNASALPQGTVGTAYSQTLTIGASTTGSVAWAIASGSLPSGLSLSQSGVISGTPSTNGTSTFSVRITDSIVSCVKQFSLQVNAAVPPISCIALKGNVNVTAVDTDGLTGTLTASVQRAVAYDSSGPKLRFINTSTNTVIATVTLAGSLSVSRGCFASSSQQFYFALGSTIKVYDKNGNFVTNIAIASGVTAYPVYSPVQDRVYVTYHTVNTHFAVINPNTNTVVGDIDSGSAPGHGPVAVYYPESIGVQKGNNWAVYNLPGGAHQGDINMGAGGSTNGFEYAANTGKIFVGAFNGGTFNSEVWEVNPATLAVTNIYTPVDTGDTINGIVYNPVTGAIITSSGFGDINVIDPTKQTIVCDLNIADQGYSLAVDYVTGNVYKANPAGGNVQFLS